MPLECSHIRNEFSALLDNELNPEDRELVEEHLSDCSDCLRELHGYKVVSDAYRYHHPVKAPDDFEERFRAAIAPIGRRRPMTLRRWGMAIAACGVGLIGVFLWQTRGINTPTLELASHQATGATESLASESAPAPPETLMFNAPAESDAPEAMLNRSAMANDAMSADGTVPSGGAPTPMLEQLHEAAPEVFFSDSDAAMKARAMSSEPVAIASPESSGESDAAVPARKGEDMAKEDGPTAAKRAPASAPTLLQWREQSFNLVNGVWQQDGYRDEVLTKVSIPSDAWNALLDRHPDLAALCDHGHPVIVALDKVWYEITVTDAPTAVETPTP